MGRNVTIKYVLQNGDHVSIIRSKNQKPKQDWLSFVVTTKAKTKIKQVLNEEKTKAAAEGKEILMRRLKNWKISIWRYSDTKTAQFLQSENCTGSLLSYCDRKDRTPSDQRGFIKGGIGRRESPCNIITRERDKRTG